MSFELGNIDYRGKEGDVHHWRIGEQTSLYWHPDWLHIAEDMTGLHKKADLDLTEGEKPTEHHALKAIRKYVQKLYQSNFLTPL